MGEQEIRDLIQAGILAHERRVGFISGVIGGLWLAANIAIIDYCERDQEVFTKTRVNSASQAFQGGRPAAWVFHKLG